MKTYFKSFVNRAAYEAYENTEDLFIAYIEDSGDVIYVNDNPATIPYTITALEDGATVNTNDCYWSIDSGDTWHYASVTPPTLNTGDSIMLKTTHDTQMRHPSIDKQYAVGGNIMSLYYTEDYFGSYIPSSNGRLLYHFYIYDTNIINAQNLIIPDPVPADDGCYNYMFGECSNLTHAPELPATKTYPRCYIGMFTNCVNLTHGPSILPAERVEQEAYSEMFYGCTSLIATPDLSKIKVVEWDGMSQMFRNSGITSISSMNVVYTSQGMQTMFADCSGLTDLSNVTINVDKIDNEARYWFYQCSNLTKTPHIVLTENNRALGWNTFEGCSSLTDASGIIIDTSNGNLFNGDWGEGMFAGCSSLDHFEIYGPEWPRLRPDMWNDVASSGTFTVPANTNYTPEDYLGNGIPSGWTIVRASN